MCKELVRLTTGDVSKGIPVTDTIIISERTKREHRVIMQLVNKYYNHISEFGRIAFEVQPFETNGGTQNRRVYLLNEMQSTFLITLMRNTPEVIEFKKNLVKSFYLMKNELQARQETRHIGVSVRKSLTDSIKNNVDEDTNFKKFAYSNYSKLVYKKILGKPVKKLKEDMGLKKSDNLRDFLTIEELERVQDLESKIAFYIEMRKDLTGNDKEIYQEVKKYVESIKDLV